MSPKVKAFIYNIAVFLPVFILLRFLLLSVLVSLNHLLVVFIAAFVTSVIVPKFLVVQDRDEQRIKMKWVFKKGVKDVGK